MVLPGGGMGEFSPVIAFSPNWSPSYSQFLNKGTRLCRSSAHVQFSPATFLLPLPHPPSVSPIFGILEALVDQIKPK